MLSLNVGTLAAGQSAMAATFVRRVIGAAMFDVATYEDVEADQGATPQALAVVVLSSLAAAIGARGAIGGAETFAFFATASAIALISWAAFAFIIFEIGARIVPAADTRGDPGELLRTLGFAATPGLFQVFGMLPGAARPVFTLAIVWALAASVIAVRQALDYSSTGRALGVCALALLLALGIAVVLGLVFGPTLSGF
jgi:hypothetical protein